jgi:membrane-associated protease RseP (regulator of RpoE activity)
VLNVLSILLMLGILSVLIIVHEFGHFSVARFFGFQTPVFGIGLPFGPSWTVGEKWGTQFRIHALLLGGYVAIPELGDESNLSAEAYGVPLKPFQKFPIWQRALVAVAGVTMNVIFAYFVMLVMVAMLGVQSDKVVVEELADNIAVARDAGVLAGDRIDAIDSLKVKSTQQVIEYLSKRKSTEVTLHLLRPIDEGKSKTDAPPTEAKAVDLKAKINADGKLGMLLIQPIEKFSGSPFELAGRAYSELYDLTGQMVSTLGRMSQSVLFGWMEHRPAGSPPAAGIGDLHGVLVVIKWGADLAQQDWTKLFTFTALISMDLAIVNLFPIPALDGGHLFFMLLEAIRGKPMEEKIQSELVKWGFISLLALMAVIMVNDIRALVTGELDFKTKSKKHQKSSENTEPKKDGAVPKLDDSTLKKDGSEPQNNHGAELKQEDGAAPKQEGAELKQNDSGSKKDEETGSKDSTQTSAPAQSTK